MAASHMAPCRKALDELQTAIEGRRWQHLARCQQFYAAAFAELRQDWHENTPSAEDIEQLKHMERQQRRLKRLLNQRRQEVQEHLGMMRQAQKRLERLRHALVPPQPS